MAVENEFDPPNHHFKSVRAKKPKKFKNREKILTNDYESVDNMYNRRR